MSYLSIYLNDHLAAAIASVELVKRAAASNAEDDAFGPPLAKLREEIEADRARLEQLLEALEIGRDRLKPTSAWLLEKLGRLKPNGQLRGYSPLSRLLELEGLALLITGKLQLWETLAELGIEQPGFDFERLAADAAMQRSTVAEVHRLAAARLADSSPSR